MNQRIKRIQHQFAIRKNKKHTVEQQIQSNFQTLSDDAKQQKIRMMHELNRFEQHLDSKLNILSSLRTEIETEKHYQSNKLSEAGRLLEDNEIGRKQRKMSILNIGNETEYRYNTKYAKLESILSEQVTKECNVNYAFKLDEKSFKKCIKYLHKYGALKCGDFGESDETKMDDANADCEKNHSIATNKSDELMIISLRSQIEQNEKEYLEKIGCLNEDIQSKVSQIRTMNGKYDRLMNEQKEFETKMNELMHNENALRLKLNEKDLQNRKLLEKYAGLKSNMNAKEMCIEAIRRKMQSKRDRIDKLERIVNEKCKELEQAKQINERMSNQIKEGEHWGEIEKWSEENEKLRTLLKHQMLSKAAEMKAYKNQIARLQQKVKLVEKQNKIKDDEIKKLRIETNRKRMQQQQDVKMDQNKKKKTMALTTKGTGNGIDYALKVKNNQRRKHQMVIAKLNKTVDKDANIGQEYVESFCKLSRINKPKVVTKHVVKAKNKQEWQCVIQLSEIGVTQKSNSNKKQMAINICFQRLANRIYKGQI